MDSADDAEHSKKIIRKVIIAEENNIKDTTMDKDLEG